MTRYYFYVVLIVVIGLILWGSSGKRIEARFREWMLKKWQGKTRKNRNWLTQETIVIVHGDREVMVRTQKVPSGWRIQMDLDWQSPKDQEFELMAGQVSEKDQGFMSVALPGLGLPKCMASDVSLAAEMLGASGKNVLAQILVALPTRRIQLVVEPRKWRIVGEVAASEFEVLGSWIMHALQLHDQMRVQIQTEVAFLNERREVLDEPICGVCGQLIETDLVRCRRCRAAHHRDCWEFNGKCSTYGCQESLWVA